MHKINRSLISILLLAYSCVSFADAANYVGIDYNVRQMKGRDRYNYAFEPVFPQTYHGYEVYAAHRFANDVGLGISWEQTDFAESS